MGAGRDLARGKGHTQTGKLDSDQDSPEWDK